MRWLAVLAMFLVCAGMAVANELLPPGPPPSLSSVQVPISPEINDSNTTNSTPSAFAPAVTETPSQTQGQESQALLPPGPPPSLNYQAENGTDGTASTPSTQVPGAVIDLNTVLYCLIGLVIIQFFGNALLVYIIVRKPNLKTIPKSEDSLSLRPPLEQFNTVTDSTLSATSGAAILDSLDTDQISQLKEYVAALRASGFSDNMIEQQLASVSWSARYIEEALKR